MLKRLQQFLTVISSSVVICLTSTSANAYVFDTSGEQFFQLTVGGLTLDAIAIPTAQTNGGYTLPTATCAPATSPCTLASVELDQFRGGDRVGDRSVEKRAGEGVNTGFTTERASNGNITIEEDRSVTNVNGLRFDNAPIAANAQSVNARVTGTPSTPDGEFLIFHVNYNEDPVTFDIETTSLALVFCDSPQGASVTQCARQEVTEVPGVTVVSPASSGGSSGGGAIAAIAIAGGAYYWWKKQNPKSRLTFTAMPTDTDAYVAEFNAKPRENLNFNIRYTEGNLFAHNDRVRPETNSTVMATVKWTW